MSSMSAKRHLRELQWRLMLVALFFIIGACLAYSFQSTLIPLLLDPLHGEKLVYLNPAGGFSFIFQISIYAGIALAFPILLQQLYGFLRPVLPVAAQRKSTIIIISSLLLLVAGITFGYFVAVPNALTFLYGFADQYVEASLTAESYLNFIIAYTIGIGIVFQLPLLLLLIHTIKPLSPGGLLKSEKWVVLVAFIIAAVITPTPDPVNQVIIAGPVIVVYQIGVVAVLISIARKSRQRKVLARQEAKAQLLLEKTKQQLQPIPVTPALLDIETPTLATPEHSPVLETALALEAASTNAPVPAHQTHLAGVALAGSHQKKTTHHQVVSTPHPTAPLVRQHHTPVKTMDGMVVRRASAPLRVPQRHPQTTSPHVVRSRQDVASQKGFYVDGITGPQQATSF